jgi:hypothetical protein
MQPTIEDNGASRLSDCLLARKLFTASTSILNPIEPYLVAMRAEKIAPLVAVST